MAVFEFGPFVLDPAKRSLLRNGLPQPLTPKAFDVLLVLVQHHERVVPKEELLGTLWPNTFVEEANLSQQIFVLRRTLNGSPEGAEYITTVPRRGYRFTAGVLERFGNDGPGQAVPVTPARRSSWVIPALIVALAAAAALLATIAWRGAAINPEPQIRRVTALPGLERSPSISPDGNFVVFSWTGSDPHDPPDLWIKAVDGEAPPRRLTETPAAEGQSAWSPDGRDNIAFIRGDKGVFIVSALDGHERQVTKSGSMVGWTPDGRSLLVRERTNEGPHGIVRIELESGTRYPVTRPPRGIGDWTFDVSPDGKTLALSKADAIDLFRFRDRTVQRVGTLPFQVSRIAGLGGMTVSRDGRWALVSTTDVWESDIMVAEGVR